MSDEAGESEKTPKVTIHSARFGDLEVPVSSIIELPGGLIGFPRATRFVMFDHKPPFSWLHSADDPNLAFVVVDGFEFGPDFVLPPPVGDKETDLREDDEYAILVIVTIRPDPRQNTANLKAPIFVNLRTRKGVQVIYDNPKLSTRFALWSEPEKPAEGAVSAEGKAEPKEPTDK